MLFFARQKYEKNYKKETLYPRKLQNFPIPPHYDLLRIRNNSLKVSNHKKIVRARQNRTLTIFFTL